ncbi:hypothetical protein ANO11243_042540 [Dothideomycetidae sp. 11243]|nr:hypothetical protein ANO11243_042540 [fungal sp. No.11243]
MKLILLLGLLATSVVGSIIDKDQQHNVAVPKHKKVAVRTSTSTVFTTSTVYTTKTKTFDSTSTEYTTSTIFATRTNTKVTTSTAVTTSTSTTVTLSTKTVTNTAFSTSTIYTVSTKTLTNIASTAFAPATVTVTVPLPGVGGCVSSSSSSSVQLATTASTTTMATACSPGPSAWSSPGFGIGYYPSPQSSKAFISSTMAFGSIAQQNWIAQTLIGSTALTDAFSQCAMFAAARAPGQNMLDFNIYYDQIPSQAGWWCNIWEDQYSIPGSPFAAEPNVGCSYIYYEGIPNSNISSSALSSSSLTPTTTSTTKTVTTAAGSSSATGGMSTTACPAAPSTWSTSNLGNGLPSFTSAYSSSTAVSGSTVVLSANNPNYVTLANFGQGVVSDAVNGCARLAAINNPSYGNTDFNLFDQAGTWMCAIWADSNNFTPTFQANSIIGCSYVYHEVAAFNASVSSSSTSASTSHTSSSASMTAMSATAVPSSTTVRTTVSTTATTTGCPSAPSLWTTNSIGGMPFTSKAMTLSSVIPGSTLSPNANFELTTLMMPNAAFSDAFTSCASSAAFYDQGMGYGNVDYNLWYSNSHAIWVCTLWADDNGSSQSGVVLMPNTDVGCSFVYHEDTYSGPAVSSSSAVSSSRSMTSSSSA